MKIYYVISSLFLNALLGKADSIVNYHSTTLNAISLYTQYHNTYHHEPTNVTNQKNTGKYSKKTTLITKANKYITAVANQGATSIPAPGIPTATQDGMQAKSPEAKQIQSGTIPVIPDKEFKGIVVSNYSSIFMDNADAYRDIYETYGGNAQYIVDGKVLVRLADDLFIDSSVIGSAYSMDKPLPTTGTTTATSPPKATTKSSDESTTTVKSDSIIENNDLFLDSIIFFAQDKWSIKVNRSFIHSSQGSLALGKNIDILRVFNDRALFVLKLNSEQVSGLVNTYSNKKIFSMTDNLYSNKNYSIILDSSKETLAVMLHTHQKFSYSNMEVEFTRDNNNRPRYTNRFTIPNKINQTAESNNAEHTAGNTASNQQNNPEALQNLFQKSEILELYQKYINPIGKQTPQEQPVEPTNEQKPQQQAGP